MKFSIVARLIATFGLATLFSLYAHHDYAHWNLLGRSAFLDHEGIRFDKYFVQPHSMPVLLLTYFLLAIPVALLYELLSVLLTKIFISRRA